MCCKIFGRKFGIVCNVIAIIFFDIRPRFILAVEDPSFTYLFAENETSHGCHESSLAFFEVITKLKILYILIPNVKQ